MKKISLKEIRRQLATSKEGIRITEAGRVRAHALSAGYPQLQGAIRNDDATLPVIVDTLAREYRSMHPTSPTRDIQRFGQQVVAALLTTRLG
jgi:hypothetical protein